MKKISAIPTFYRSAIRLSCALMRWDEFRSLATEIFQLDELDARERYDTLKALKGCVPEDYKKDYQRMLWDAEDEYSLWQEDYDREQREAEREYLQTLTDWDRRHGLLD